MSWLFVPQVVAPSWDSEWLTEPHSAPSVSSRTGLMQWPPSSRTLKADTYLSFLSGIRLKPSTAYRGVAKWISSLESFSPRDLKTPLCWNPSVESWQGLKHPEPSSRLVPNLSDLNHSLEQLAVFNPWVSKWKQKRSPQDNSASRMDVDDSSYHSPEIAVGNLWPTPGHRDWKGPSGLKRTLKKMQEGKSPDSLPTAIRIWSELAESPSDFPTLQSLGITRLGPKSWSLPHTAVPLSQSRLPASFVEWLMGLPIGWTACGP